MNKGLAALLAFLAGSMFGLGGTTCQIIRGFGFETMQIIVGQMIAGVIILGVMVATKYKYAIPRKETIQLFLLGIINSFAGITYFFAISMLSVGTTTAIQFQYVWIVVLLSALIFHKKPGKWTVISCVLIVFGTLFGSGMFDDIVAGQFTMNPQGLLLAFTCAFCYSLQIFLNGHIAVNYNPVQRTFTQTCGSLLSVSVVALLLGTPSVSVAALAPFAFAMSLITCIFPVLFIVIASSNLPDSLVSVLTSSELPVAVLSGYLLLGETVTPNIVFGVVIIVGSIALAQLDNRVPRVAMPEAQRC